MKIKISNARWLDAATGLDAMGDVLIAHGRIVALPMQGTPSNFDADQTIDATGWVGSLALVDLRARLGTGLAASEIAAAQAGGVAHVLCPPDSDPPLDSPELVRMLRYRAAALTGLQVHLLGSLTLQLAGQTLSPMPALMQAGCVGLAQPDRLLDDLGILLRAMQYAATFDVPIWLTPMLPAMSQGEAASGAVAHRMGLRGVPAAAEVLALEQIFELMRMTGARVHLSCVSTARGVLKVREAKASGLPLTADASMHNVLLTEAMIANFDSDARLWPPLRSSEDASALSEALQDGTLDAMVSDHSWVPDDDKALPFAVAKPGATGLELLLPMALLWAQQQGLDWCQALRVVASGPAKLVSMLMSEGGQATDVDTLKSKAPAACLQVGARADLMLFDPQASWLVSPEALVSDCKHTPLMGQVLQGQVMCTLHAGQVVFSRRV